MIAILIVMLHTGWAELAVDGDIDVSHTKNLNIVLSRRDVGIRTTTVFACPITGSGLELAPRDGWLLATSVLNPQFSAADLIALERDIRLKKGDTEAAERLTGIGAEQEISKLQVKLKRWNDLALL